MLEYKTVAFLELHYGKLPKSTMVANMICAASTAALGRGIDVARTNKMPNALLGHARESFTMAT